jgi:hypothetical protein
MRSREMRDVRGARYMQIASRYAEMLGKVR